MVPLAPISHNMGYVVISLLLSVWVMIECAWFLLRSRPDHSTRHTPLAAVLPAAVATFLHDCAKYVGQRFQSCLSWLPIILLGFWGSIMHLWLP